jgi:hypothetical protein
MDLDRVVHESDGGVPAMSAGKEKQGPLDAGSDDPPGRAQRSVSTYIHRSSFPT